MARLKGNASLQAEDRALFVSVLPKCPSKIIIGVARIAVLLHGLGQKLFSFLKIALLESHDSQQAQSVEVARRALQDCLVMLCGSLEMTALVVGHSLSKKLKIGRPSLLLH